MNLSIFKLLHHIAYDHPAIIANECANAELWVNLMGANHLSRNTNQLSDLVAGQMPDLMLCLYVNYAQIEFGSLQSVVLHSISLFR